MGKQVTTNQAIRDAKGRANDLTATLSRKDPWDREVELQRESLRKVYLRILFTPHVPTPVDSAQPATKPAGSPAAIEAQHAARLLDVLNALWLETSHASIQIYRNKIQELDRLLADAPPAQRGNPNRQKSNPALNSTAKSNSATGKSKSAPPPGPTARRRITASFKTFLVGEEDFYKSLISRFSPSLYPSDLVGLQPLGISLLPLDPNDDEDDDASRDEQLTQEEAKLRRDKILPLVHKALICFGDLARYREVYNETSATSGNASGGRKESKKGNGRKPEEKKVKNWARAAECYLQARLLLPENGNPSNQLAVLANYSHDVLSSSYHYYRALSVKAPFPAARMNLEITYGKAVGNWVSDSRPSVQGDEGAQFQVAFVALQGLFFLRKNVEEVARLEEEVERLFKISIEQRLLASDTIVKTAVTTLCSSWHARLNRTTVKKSGERSSKSIDTTPTTQINLEPHILIHILSLYRILLSVGATETDELYESNLTASPVEGEETRPLATNISAVLRRILPAIRILSKWIMGQLEYIDRTEARVDAQEKKFEEAANASLAESAQGQPTTTETTDQLSYVRTQHFQETIVKFWVSYSTFCNSLSRAFPLDDPRLPNLNGGAIWLEEDVDMLGFAPLRRGMREGVTVSEGTGVEISRVGKDVHPNEEQLMRIAEIQLDAFVVAQSEVSLIVYEEGRFLVPGYEIPTTTDLPRLVVPPSLPTTPEDDEDEEEEEEEEEATEDDPVDLAMRIATVDRMEMDGEDEEEEEEEIVYQSLNGIPHSARASPSLLPHPDAPVISRQSSIPRHAGDLLHQVLGGSPNHPASSNGAVVGGSSIWSMSNGISNTTTPLASARASFESLPNILHFDPATPALPLPPPPTSNNSPFGHPQYSNGGGNTNNSFFTNFSPFDGSSVANRALPPPTSTTTNQYASGFGSAMGMGIGNASDLSATANVFSGGWSNAPSTRRTNGG